MHHASMLGRLNAALEGRYRIERELGEGGMATVYLAEDLKHDRQVAIKVLRPELAAVVGAERFLAEIKTTANLQHPHILPLFDSGEADGFLFYVMPYVKGESLRDRLDREHQLPVDQAVELTRKVAAALQHAHDQGIVHRDIKPANILLSEGEPLVADFGIALAVSQAGGGRITETGLSLGTPHYMSPEQASGDRSLDPRSDVYALGCVAYEALVGEPPFPGPTPQAVLARILTGKAQRVSASRPTVPAHVDAAVARALEKLPADRFESVADFRKAIDNAAFRHTAAATAEPTAPVRATGRWRDWALPAVLGLAVLLALWGWLRPSPTQPFREFEIALDSASSGFGPMFALSADGGAVAYYNFAPALAIRPLTSTDVRWIPQDLGVRTPFFSPDGSMVAFHEGPTTNNSLRWVRVDGGGSIRVDQDVYPGGTWSDDGYIYYARNSDHSLWRARPQGGAPEQLPQPEGAEFAWPDAIAGGGRLLVEYQDSSEEEGRRLVLYDPASGDIEAFEEAGLSNARFARHAGGYLFWVDDQDNLLAARCDGRHARLTSDAMTLGTGVLVAGASASNIEVAEDGTLLYARGIAAGSGQGENLAWVTRSGAIEVIEDRWATQLSDFDGLALGADERYVAAQVDPPSDQEEQEIWILDTQQSTVYPLTFDGGTYDPEWLDERRVAYVRYRDGARGAVYAQPFDRSGSEETILELDRPIADLEVAPGGSPLVLTLGSAGDDPDQSRDIYLVDPGDPETLRPFVATAFSERQPAVSPDDRWLAYVSDESGRPEVYVRAFPDGGRPWPISTDGGTVPRWGPDSDELYFDVDGTLTVARLDFSRGVDVSSAEPLFATTPFELSGYQPSRDGERLLMIREPEGSAASTIVLMLNVFDEIERRLAR